MRTSAALLLLVGVLAACGDNAASPPDATLTECADSIDNDQDGTIDYPADLGCSSAEDETEGSAEPQCADGLDNDDDGFIDFPNDPGCPAPQFDSETDGCPGANCPQCADGIDNDGNGKIDFAGMDPGCESAGDLSEFTLDPDACGAGLTVKPLPITNTDTGMLQPTSLSNLVHPCGPIAAPAIAYVLTLASPKVIVASTDDPVTMIDTIIDVRSSMCDQPSAEIACHDNIATTNTRSKLTKALNAGTYYIVVSTRSPTGGQYKLTVDLLPGAGEPCMDVMDCGPGLECRIPTGGTTKQCIGPVCDDAIDDDGDGKKDYPFDPGCATPTDSTEDDVCNVTPTDPACPKCANTLDDDMDGMTDFPNDLSCKAASTPNESCPQSEEVIVATTPTTSSTTIGAVNDYTPPPGSFNGHACSTTSTTIVHTAPDVAIALDVPPLKSLSLKLGATPPATSLFNTTQILFDGTCGGTPIDCYDSPTLMVANNLAAGRYFLVVDGFSGAVSGAFTLTTSGVIVNGESCESPLATSGALRCDAGYACLGTAGSRTCMPSECNDGIDNNADGKMDFPADPGCATLSDPSEDTVCPGPACPVCGDGLDNDGDMLIDYPLDTGCVSAAGPSEGCAESDPIIAITGPATTGTLVGAIDDHNPSCVTSNFPDRIYTLDVSTTLQSLTIDTEGSVTDTVLSFMNTTCAEPSLACDDDGGVGVGDSLITRAFVTPGSYTIAVDADTATIDTFNLNIRGVINPGGSCEGPMFAAGAFACPLNFACNGPAGSRTCSASQCLDGVDNNNDGNVDFPADPGCTSGSDNTESNVCPGASCPLCADGLDNDSDGTIDYPADAGCTSASSNIEACFDTDAILPITSSSMSGTLVGKANDRQPQCVISAGVDVVYSLPVPNLESLTIHTAGSAVDTALSLMTSDCSSSTALACDDDSGVDTGDSMIQRGFLPAGNYTIGVDADTTTPNTYNLSVKGVIIPGGSCESPLVAAGVLSCSVGFACDGPAGAKTCVVAECIDGADNNSDGKADFPNDPGCDSFSDNTETTVCPGVDCPVCSDSVDNDLDGLTDYPADQSCFAASADTEACNQSEDIQSITQMITTGNTAGLSNDVKPSCSTSTVAHSAPDLAYQFDLPAMASLSLDLAGTGTPALSLLDSTCGGTAIVCRTSAGVLTTPNLAAGRFYVVVDGSTTTSGPYVLTTTGVIAPGGSCETPLFTDGAFTCPTNHSCVGPTGARTCTPAACADMTDNDGDTKSDYPNDPGCASPDDNDETDSCPGAGCPACANGADDDADTLIDFPADTRCPSAAFYAENACTPEAPADLRGHITGPTTVGNLVTASADNYEQVCATSTVNDLTYGLDLPVPVDTLTIDTLGSEAPDTVLSLWEISCTGTPLGCDDDSAPDTNGTDNRSVLVVPNVAAGRYSIQVDAFTSTSYKQFFLNVKGTLAAGTACTSPLFTSGVLVCAAGSTCTAGTCQ